MQWSQGHQHACPSLELQRGNQAYNISKKRRKGQEKGRRSRTSLSLSDVLFVFVAGVLLRSAALSRPLFFSLCPSLEAQQEQFEVKLPANASIVFTYLNHIIFDNVVDAGLE